MMGHNGGPPMPPQPTEEQQQMLASPTWEDVIALLRDEPARQFRIDVETDSTVEPDDEEQKASAIELTTAIGTFISTWGPQVQANPALAPLAAGVLKFAIRRFRAGRELEALIEQTLGQIMGAPQQQQGQAATPPPDKTPVEVAQLNLEREKVKQDAETQRAMMDASVQAGDQAIAADDQRLKLIMGGRDPEPQVQA
jgi:hypothetical protein